MLACIHKSKVVPEVLAITPLLPTHKIPKETKIAILRNDIAFDWISWSDSNAPQQNMALGLAAYIQQNPKNKLKYIIMIDNDILSTRNMLLNMYDTLSRTNDNIAYTYCDFAFSGTIQHSFKGIEFDSFKLINENYISGVSLIKLDKLREVGGFVTDAKYKRLSDWALWLKFLNHGLHGIRCKNSAFIARSSTTSISAGNNEEYIETYKLIKQDFIVPLLDGLVY